MTIDPRADDRYIGDATEVTQKIGGIPGVIGVTKRLSQPVIISQDDRMLSFEMTGIDPLNEKTVSTINNHIIRGEFLDETDTDSVILGVLLAGDGQCLSGEVQGDSFPPTIIPLENLFFENWRNFRTIVFEDRGTPAVSI